MPSSAPPTHCIGSAPFSALQKDAALHSRHDHAALLRHIDRDCIAPPSSAHIIPSREPSLSLSQQQNPFLHSIPHEMSFTRHIRSAAFSARQKYATLHIYFDHTTLRIQIECDRNGLYHQTCHEMR